MNRYIITFGIVFIGLVFFIPRVIWASNLFFETDHSIYGTNDEIKVDVYLDSENQTINTISADITIRGIRNPSIDIIDGNSSILFWIDKPSFKKDTSSISFSGITPGGLNDNKIFLFSILVTNQEPNDTLSFSLSQSHILLHDGNGTKITTRLIPKNVFVSPDSNFSQSTQNPIDSEPPEDFTPKIVEDENLFEGQKTLLFATQDKGTGLDYFEVKEGYFSTYRKAESPYLLQHQNSWKTIFVRAIDRSGNERLAVIHPQKNIFVENFILIFSILIVIVIIAIIVIRRRTHT